MRSASARWHTIWCADMRPHRRTLSGRISLNRRRISDLSCGCANVFIARRILRRAAAGLRISVIGCVEPTFGESRDERLHGTSQTVRRPWPDSSRWKPPSGAGVLRVGAAGGVVGSIALIAGLPVIAARAVHARGDARLELFEVERQLLHACHLLPFGLDA